MLAEAGYLKSGRPVLTEVVYINNSDSPSLQLVFGNRDGSIDTSLPTEAPPNWNEENVIGNLNALAVYSGLFPDAFEKGIPVNAYRTRNDEAWWNAFLQDLVNRGEPMWIKVAPDKKSGGKYTRFSYIVGPAAEGEVWEPASEEAEEASF